MRDRLLALAQAGNMEAGNHLARQLRLRETAFDLGPMAQLVVDSNGVLIVTNGRARSLFGMTQRDAGRPLQDLEISYRPVELRSLIEQSYKDGRPLTLENIERTFSDGRVQYLDVQVTPVLENGTCLGVSITFNDRTHYYKLREDLQRHQQELETAYEELQSANEELETTNEELQSTNEELQTINEQLRQRTDEIKQTNAFLQSILGSLHSGVAVLDNKIDIVAWNNSAEDLWGLRADEVTGQSFMNLDIGLPVEKLKASIRSCLMEQGAFEEAVLDAINRRGKTFKCRVSCTPIISADREHHGVILMMEELEEK